MFCRIQLLDLIDHLLILRSEVNGFRSDIFINPNDDTIHRILSNGECTIEQLLSDLKNETVPEEGRPELQSVIQDHVRQSNGTIRIVGSTTEKLESFKRRIQQTQGDPRIRLTIDDTGHVEILLDGKKMRIRARRGKDIAKDLCLLLLGKACTNGVRSGIREYASRISDPSFHQSGEYTIGEPIDINCFAQMIYPDEWRDRDRHRILRKKMWDALNRLQRRAELELGRSIFEFEDDTVRIRR